MDDKWLTTGQMLDRLLDGEVATNDKDKKVYLSKGNGSLYWKNIGSMLNLPVSITDDFLLAKWRITPDYISFEKVIKALEDGKTVLYYPEEQADPVEVKSGNWISNLGSVSTWDELIHANWSIVEDKHYE
jgi:hypothetical protein